MEDNESLSNYRKLPDHRIIPNNPKHEWIIKSYPGCLHMIFMQGSHAGVFAGNKLYPFSFKSSNIIVRNDEFSHFWDMRDINRIRKIFLNKCKNDFKFITDFYSHWETLHKKLIQEYEKIDSIDLSTLSDKELFDLYGEVYCMNIIQGGVGYSADFCLSSGEHDWLSSIIEKRTNGKDQNIMKTLTLPAVPSYSNEEDMNLFRIWKKIGRKFENYAKFSEYVRKNLSKDIKSHQKKYFWVENNYFPKILDEEYFIRKLYSHSESGIFEDYRKMLTKNRHAKEKLLISLNDMYLTNVIKTVEFMTHMQDYRKMALVRFSHYMTRFFAEMAKRTGLTLQDYMNTLEPELEDIFLNNKIDRFEIKSRKKFTFISGLPDGYVIYTGKKIEKYVTMSDFVEEHMDIRELKGVPACNGIVRGIVRIVKNAHAHEFRQGEILVTNNTTPEFVPLMKKALAIVTEQGGITTHAAIVSRELGVPCVIGTKIATRVLKTGDKVEVDANKGVVRKI